MPDNNVKKLVDFIQSKKFPPFVFDKVGALATFMAMAPQGIFASLLVDDYMQDNDWNLYERFAVMLAVFIATEEGKRQLLRFFNEEDFKNLPQFVVNLFKPKNWSLLNLVSALLTLHIAGVFVDLTQVSLEQGSEFFGHYNTEVTDAFAEYLKDPKVQASFMGASGLTNVLGFPNMFRGLTGMMKEVIYAGAETPEYRRYRQLIRNRLKSVRKQWIKDCKNNGILAGNKALLEKFPPGNVAEYTVDTLIDRIKSSESAVQLLGLSHALNPQEIIPLESWPSFIGKHASALSLTAIASTGMYNFRDFGEQMYERIGADPVAPVGGWTAYGGMVIMMMVIVYPSLLGLWDHVSGQTPSMRMLEQSMWQLITVISIATFICTLGGAANTYQSDLAGEDSLMMAFSEIGSFLTEFAGVMAVTSGYRMFNRQRAPGVADVKAVNDALLALENEEEISDALIEQLPDEATAADEETLLIPDPEDGSATPPRFRGVVRRIGFFETPAVATAINDDEEAATDESQVSLVRRVFGC